VSEPIRSTDQNRAPQRQDGEENHHSDLTRRGLIAGAGALGAAAVLGAGTRVAQPTAAQSRLIEAAMGAASSNASLSDIQHIVVLMQENGRCWRR
jgi:phospholipase C